MPCVFNKQWGDVVCWNEKEEVAQNQYKSSTSEAVKPNTDAKTAFISVCEVFSSINKLLGKGNFQCQALFTEFKAFSTSLNVDPIAKAKQEVFISSGNSYKLPTDKPSVVKNEPFVMIGRNY